VTLFYCDRALGPTDEYRIIAEFNHESARIFTNEFIRAHSCAFVVDSLLLEKCRHSALGNWTAGICVLMMVCNGDYLAAMSRRKVP
jgi:hypothetical protein